MEPWAGRRFKSSRQLHLFISLTYVMSSERLLAEQKGVLGLVPLVAIGVSAIFGLRNLPITAQYGLSSVTIYLLATILFFVPSALVCSYFSKKCTQAGGLYAWVKDAFGERYGFIAMWLEWVNTIISFPMMISFVIFSLVYSFSPAVATADKTLEFFLFIIVFWFISLMS